MYGRHLATSFFDAQNVAHATVQGVEAPCKRRRGVGAAIHWENDVWKENDRGGALWARHPERTTGAASPDSVPRARELSRRPALYPAPSRPTLRSASSPSSSVALMHSSGRAARMASYATRVAGTAVSGVWSSRTVATAVVSSPTSHTVDVASSTWAWAMAPVAKTRTVVLVVSCSARAPCARGEGEGSACSASRRWPSCALAPASPVRTHVPGARVRRWRICGWRRRPRPRPDGPATPGGSAWAHWTAATAGPHRPGA